MMEIITIDGLQENKCIYSGSEFTKNNNFESSFSRFFKLNYGIIILSVFSMLVTIFGSLFESIIKMYCFMMFNYLGVSIVAISTKVPSISTASILNSFNIMNVFSTICFASIFIMEIVNLIYVYNLFFQTQKNLIVLKHEVNNDLKLNLCTYIIFGYNLITDCIYIMTSIIAYAKFTLFHGNYIEISLSSISDKLPQITINAGPLDKLWSERLKEELRVLIGYVALLKDSGEEWFNIKPLQDGTKWEGVCWYTHNLKRYEFAFRFDIPEKYPITPFEIEIPELDGKTLKMYRGGKICLDTHFIPLWLRNCPKFGIAHILALGLAPWLAAEIPFLVSSCKI
ncbi:Ubiquitin-fold modifier-conjugating enzyme 1 family protein [Cryptosporidium meleagridis]|uniref:Ubiquitin-fold modifier-conjugating enzyme 1 n=1 Tax=Cryptosporidium meleagridis TaxID=93969 RepID=A0A2P4Z3Z4_9CRYT|nr:Ubiquitin-fold modifier-conjugating enzyme 1 family protein [Cryptosporidium meleagridis]